MVNKLIAIISGISFIVIAILSMQLIYILLAVGYNALAKDYVFLKDIAWVFKYIVGVPVVLIIMFTGGYITSFIAKTHPIQNTLIVGFLVIGGMMWSALSALANAELTLSGVIINIIMLAMIVIGGLAARHRRVK